MARQKPFRPQSGGPRRPAGSPSRPGRPKGLGTGRPKPASFARKAGGPPRKTSGPSGIFKKGFKTSRPKPPRDREANPDSDRLQKILAHAGVDSRRACEDLILQGRITVNGKVVRELGTRVDPDVDVIEFDGQKVKIEKLVYYAVNKPKGYVSTNSDPSGRPRVVDILPEIPQRVYTVGRLDEDSTGLILLTNDGELANRLAHPRFGVEKFYRVLVAGLPSQEVLQRVTDGVWLADGKVRAKRVKIIGRQGEATNLELVLAEGKNREVRRIFAKMGHKVMNLTRVAVGPILLRGLASGESRPLTKEEIELLQKVAAGIDVSPHRSKGKERPAASRGAAGKPKPGPGVKAAPGAEAPGGATETAKPASPAPGESTPIPAKLGPIPGGLKPNTILSSGAVVGARPGTGSRPAQPPRRPDSRPGTPDRDRRPSKDDRDWDRDRRRSGPSGARSPGRPPGGRPTGSFTDQRPSGPAQAGPPPSRPGRPSTGDRKPGRVIIGLDPSFMPDRDRPRQGRGQKAEESRPGSGPDRPEKSKQKRPPRAAHGVKRKPRSKDRG
ncbi:MAG: hypothetical protein ABS79_06625 [Planctomycetes bacterium SCN 63-9]|nr:MAG: hypothetical protein ABS79_06625 [Planctomycetes bacterium SCN 63-9]